jgi:hypothetical protein
MISKADFWALRVIFYQSIIFKKHFIKKLKDLFDLIINKLIVSLLKCTIADFLLLIKVLLDEEKDSRPKK